MNADFHEMQLAAITLRGLLRGLDDLGVMNDPRHTDVVMAMITASVPIAERLADDISALAEGS